MAQAQPRGRNTNWNILSVLGPTRWYSAQPSPAMALPGSTISTSKSWIPPRRFLIIRLLQQTPCCRLYGGWGEEGDGMPASSPSTQNHNILCLAEATG